MLISSSSEAGGAMAEGVEVDSSAIAVAGLVMANAQPKALVWRKFLRFITNHPLSVEWLSPGPEEQAQRKGLLADY
jgi:hypothetical protein